MERKAQFSTHFSTHFRLKIALENGMKIGRKSLLWTSLLSIFEKWMFFGRFSSHFWKMEPEMRWKMTKKKLACLFLTCFCMLNVTCQCFNVSTNPSPKTTTSLFLHSIAWQSLSSDDQNPFLFLLTSKHYISVAIFAETALHSCGLNHWWYHTEAVMHKVAQVFLPKNPDELSFHFRKRVWLEPRHLQTVCLKLIPRLADDVTSLRLNDSRLNSSRRYSCFAFLTVTTHH